MLAEPLPELTDGAASSFWTAADIVIALPISWFPLAADYTRHVRSGRAAFAGASIGYGLATVVMFTLGVLALAAYGSSGLDVVDALLAVPLGAVAVLVLVAVELDEAFANLYSTAVSAQNVVPRADRRVLAVVVGVARDRPGPDLRHRRLRAVPLPDRRGVRAAGRRLRRRLRR